MTDSTARELKGHNILALERFSDSTRHMVELLVKKSDTVYGVPSDEVRLFLSDAEYQQILSSHERKQIKIKRYAHVVEGHIVIVPRKSHRK